MMRAWWCWCWRDLSAYKQLLNVDADDYLSILKALWPQHLYGAVDYKSKDDMTRPQHLDVIDRVLGRFYRLPSVRVSLKTCHRHILSLPLTFERAHFYLNLDLTFLFRFSSTTQNIITVSPFWKSSLFFQSRDPSCPLVTLLSIRSMSFRLLDIVVFFIILVKKWKEALWFPSKCHRMPCVPQGESESHGNVNTRPQFCSVKIIIDLQPCRSLSKLLQAPSPSAGRAWRSNCHCYPQQSGHWYPSSSSSLYRY